MKVVLKSRADGAGVAIFATYRCPISKIRTQVSISLDEYLALCGKPRTKASKDELRKAVSKELDLLYHISIEWYELRKGETRHFLKMRLCDQVDIINGYITVNFTTQIAEYLTHAYVTQYPLALLAVDGRQRAAYYAGKKLAFHYGLRQNRKKGSYNCISVSKLLEAIPEIPSINVINETDAGHWARRIQQPLEKALDVLIKNGILGMWEYCLAGKDPYRYLVWLLHNAPEQSQKDEDWPEFFLPVNAPKECRS